MKFIIGEGALSVLERLAYRGGIGLYFTNTLTGVLAYAIFGIVCILSLIGLFTVLGFLLSGGIKSIKKWRETPGEYWRRTGRMK